MAVITDASVRQAGGELTSRGYMVMPDVVARVEIAELISITARLEEVPALRRRSGAVYAARNILEEPAIVALATGGPLGRLAAALAGGPVRAVRRIFFDKVPGVNWSVVWHQDTTIAVRERREIPGFGPWSVKAGIQHVRPPAAVLESMVTLRLHLDDCGEGNGPLEVIPGSHSCGLIPEGQIGAIVAAGPIEPCAVPAGGVLAMKPLILHASEEARRPGHRRVIHIEYATDALPGGLEWYWSAAEARR